MGPSSAHLHAIMGSEYMQSSLQLGVGMLVACLFTYLHPISFPPISCVIATWVCVVAVMASPANHLGVRINSAASVVGSTWLGAVLGAAVSSIGHATGPLYSSSHTAVVGVLAALVLAVLSTVRVAQSPPLLWAQGMNACLSFGLTALNTYAQPTTDRVWYITGTLVLANAVSAAVVVLVAALVLPTHATEEVQNSMAHALLLSGVATSRYAGRLFRPDAPAGATTAVTNTKNNATAAPATSKAQPQPKGHVASAAVPAKSSSQKPSGSTTSSSSDSSLDEEDEESLVTSTAVLTVADCLIEPLSLAELQEVAASSAYDATVDVESGPQLPGGGDAPLPLIVQEAHTEQEWLDLMRRHSRVKAAAPDASSHPKPQPPITTLRPRLAKAQTLFMSAAAVEPQWLRGGWRTLLGRPGCYWFDAGAWSKAGGCLQLLLTRLSALEAVIEDGGSLNADLNPGLNPDLLNHISLVYSKVATSLAHMSHTVMVYGSGSKPALNRPHSGLPGGQKQPPAKAGVAAGDQSDQQQRQQQEAEVAAVCGRSVDQQQQQQQRQQQQEAEVAAACGRSVDQQHCWQQLKGQLTALMREECEGHWSDVMKAADDSPVILPSLTGVRHIMFTWTLTSAIIDTISDLEQAVAAAVYASPKPQSLLNRSLGWLRPTLPALTGQSQVVHCYRSVCVDLPNTLKQGAAGARDMAASPLFQAGLKYWLVLAILFEVTLVVLYAAPAIRPLSPAFGFVAASLSMSERVEATVSKFVFWVTGTMLGGALGFLAMWHPALAGNPYGLVAVTVGVALVVGMLGVTKARVGITLVLMTLSTLILCQCCEHVGNWAMSVTRVSSVLFGVITAVLVCNLLLPWYTSAWSIQTMRGTYITAIQLVSQMHAQFFADGAAAVAAYEAQLPKCPPLPDNATSYRPAAAAAAAAAAEDVKAPTVLQSGDAAASVAGAAAQVAAAAGEASAAIARKGHKACPLSVTPAVLQSLIARRLVSVQTSLLMDTVAWQRGVLATPPVVPALLHAMFGLLDRLAGLQLALKPPSITNSYTGAALLHYGVPMAKPICEMLHLCGQLGAAVADVLVDPSCPHAQAVHDALSGLQAHRVTMYTHMQQLRQQLHADVHRQHRRLQQLLREQQHLSQQGHGTALQGQICPVQRQMAVILGGVDDVVRFMGFQFASIKALNLIGAVASVAAQEACRARNSKVCALK